MTAKSPPARRSPAEQARLDEVVHDVFERRIRFHGVLGLRVTSLTPGAVALAFSMEPELVGHYMHGRLHGGVIATALDAAASLAVTVAVAEKFCDESVEQLGQRFARFSTIDMRTDFLSQGMGATFKATGKMIRLGGRIAHVQMTLENEAGTLIATGSTSYVVS